MNARARRAARAAMAVALALASARCAADPSASHVRREADVRTSADVQRLALDSLFNGRERAQRLVLWSSDAADGPALESMIPETAIPRMIDVTRLALSLPATTMTEANVAELFRENADGWAAFYRENPGASGLVELSSVWLSGDGQSAETYVGRSCGEHCRNAWRISARRAGSRWVITELQWLRVAGT